MKQTFVQTDFLPKESCEHATHRARHLKKKGLKCHRSLVIDGPLCKYLSISRLWHNTELIIFLAVDLCFDRTRQYNLSPKTEVAQVPDIIYLFGALCQAWWSIPSSGATGRRVERTSVRRFVQCMKMGRTAQKIYQQGWLDAVVFDRFWIWTLSRLRFLVLLLLLFPLHQVQVSRQVSWWFWPLQALECCGEWWGKKHVCQ